MAVRSWPPTVQLGAGATLPGPGGDRRLYSTSVWREKSFHRLNFPMFPSVFLASFWQILRLAVPIFCPVNQPQKPDFEFSLSLCPTSLQLHGGGSKDGSQPGHFTWPHSPTLSGRAAGGLEVCGIARVHRAPRP